MLPFFVYMYRVSGDKKVIFGAPAHNRINKGFQKTVGLFIEIFPLVMELSEDDTFFDVLERVKLETNDYLRFAKPGMVVPEVGRNFNTIFNFINASFSNFNGLPMKSEWMHTNHIDITHQLRCHIYDFDATGNMEVHFDLNKAVFNDDLAEQVPLHFLRLVDAMLNDVNQPIVKQALLTQNETVYFLRPELTTSNKYISIIDVFSAIVSLGFAIYLAVNNYGVYALVYSSILQFLLSNFMYLYLGLKKYLKRKSAQGIFLETAHPVKFLDVVEPVLNETIEYPQQILDVIDKEKISTKISTYNELKSYLISTK